MDFSTIFVVFLLSLQIQGIRSDDDCGIENFPDWDKDKKYTLYTVVQHLQKTGIGNVVFNETCHNIKEVEITSDSKVYFDISFQDESKTRLIMKATEKLSNIDKDYRHIEKSSVSTITMIKFTCNNDTEKTGVNVDDVNTRGPEFSKTSYEFSLPMPMPAKISLTMFGDNPIMVRDQDFSTTDITFSSDYKNLVFDTIYDKSKDTLDDFPYTLGMNFSSFTRLEEDTKIKIYAKDNGHPEPKTSGIEISFLIDHQESEYVPSFKQPSFLYDYDQDEGTILAEDIDVTIVNPRNGTECELAEPYQDHFQTPVLTENVVKIQLKEKLPDDIVSQKTLRVTLTCAITNGVKSSADVLISIPEISVLFSKSTYSAKYIIEQDVHKVDMTDAIKVIGNTDHIVIEVENEYHDYFGVDHTDGSDEWLLKKTKDLSEELLDNMSLNIVIDIKSSRGTFRDKAIIMLLLPNGQTGVKFTDSFMTGNYVVDENGQGKLSAVIEFNLNSRNVEVKGERLLGEYNQYFKVNYQEPSTFTVSLQGDLPKDALKSSTIYLTLQVDLGLGAVSQTAEATFVVQISDSRTTTEPTTTTPPTNPTKAPTHSPTDGTTENTKPPTKEPTAPTNPTKAPTHSPTDGTTENTKPPTKEPTAPTNPTKAPTHSPTDGTTENTKPPTKEPTEHTTQHPTESTTKKAETADDCDQTVWIVVTIILSLLLVLYIGASLLYYFKKMRNRGINHDFLPEPKEENEDRYKKKTSQLKSSLKNVATRRPTGYVRYDPDADKEDDYEKSDNGTENNTLANGNATPSPPPMPTTDNPKNNKDENTTDLNETLADALKKAVLERESRLI
ncbi:hypothetical protein WA026_008191 [Henosepilachna vigintioctopunctata]|uniref:Uncharacterized protein n=1 Tax=Henosepilachna vigintioctopunctata TaxID=420089 RepID=A0AAW1TTZ0_9CUCU